MIRRSLALLLVTTLATQACASASYGRYNRRDTLPQAPVTNAPALIADFAQKIPPGTRVRVERASGAPIRGTLMNVSPTGLVVQRNTRIPETPIEIPLDTVTRLTVENERGGLGKAIAIGTAVGVGATMGVLMLLAALISD
jgi:hypothetical protein